MTMSWDASPGESTQLQGAWRIPQRPPDCGTSCISFIIEERLAAPPAASCCAALLLATSSAISAAFFFALTARICCLCCFLFFALSNLIRTKKTARSAVRRASRASRCDPTGRFWHRGTGKIVQRGTTQEQGAHNLAPNGVQPSSLGRIRYAAFPLTRLEGLCVSQGAAPGRDVSSRELTAPPSRKLRQFGVHDQCMTSGSSRRGGDQTDEAGSAGLSALGE